LNWDTPVQSWALNSGWVPTQPPTEYDDVHVPENQPALTIVSPGDGQTVNQRSINIYALAFANLGIRQVDFFFNEQLIGIATQDPYQFTFKLPPRLTGNNHIIKVRAYDRVFNRQEAQTRIYVAAPDVIIDLPQVDN